MYNNSISVTEIAKITGSSRQAIYSLLNKLKNVKGEKDFEKIIAIKPHGRSLGDGRTLTAKQERVIQNNIKEKCPDQLKFDFTLWTREAVKLLIQSKYRIDMPIRTVGQYLQRWGYTPQKPVKYAYERDPEKVENFLKNTYPRIKRRAKRLKADIFWGDETTVKACDVRGRGYAPKGKTPVVRPTEKKENVSMISAITNQGKVFWRLHEGSINAEKVLDFIKRLIKNAGRKIFIILDNAKTHHSKVVSSWVEKNSDKVEIYYLPPYSPDLNPDEHVNSDVKYGVGIKMPRRTKEALREATQSHMKMLKKNPDRIKKYFEDTAIFFAS
jgi:transposase